MRIRSFIPALFLVAALVLVALSYRNAPEAPMVDESSTYIPRTEAVQWMSLGHNSTAASLLWINGLVAYGESLFTGKTFRWVTHLADASTRLDSLFKTPYQFVGAVTPISEKDTSDIPVLRRGVAQYPHDWQLALMLSLRLAEGPDKDFRQAAEIMEVFASDTSVPPHIRTLHQSFYLQTQTTEIALAMIIDDCLNPNYAGYRSSLLVKAAKVLGRTPNVPAEVAPVWAVLQPLIDHQLEPSQAFIQLKSLRLNKAP